MDNEEKGGINEDSQISGLGNCVDGIQGQNKFNFEQVESEDVKYPSRNVKQAPLTNLFKYKYLFVHLKTVHLNIC